MATNVAQEAMTLRERREIQKTKEKYANQDWGTFGTNTSADESLELGGQRERCHLYKDRLELCQALAYRKHKPLSLYCSMERKDWEECRSHWIGRLKDDAIIQKQNQLKREGKWPPPGLPEAKDPRKPDLRKYGPYGFTTF